MPFEPFPDKNQPDLNHNISIWRYMDFAKFTSLLSTESLYFCQVALLGDPFEGSLLKDIIDRVKRSIERPEAKRTPEEIRNIILNTRTHTYASCWHMNEYESAAMWDTYASSGYGIAIRSTVGRIKKAIEKVSEPVYIGIIRYLNYETDTVSQNTAFTPLLQKRKSFEHERELRALVKDKSGIGGFKLRSNPNSGRKISIDINALIKKIYISPTAPDWYHQTVKSTAKAFGFGKIDINQSNMVASPKFGPT